MNTTHVLAQELKPFLPWHQARLDCLSRRIVALLQVRPVNLTQLALAFDVSVQNGSVYQRLKRFFRTPVFETDQVAVRVTRWLGFGEWWLLCLDRTHWQLGRQPINLLVLSVAYRGVSVPLMWTALEKKGKASTVERIGLMERFLARFPLERIDCLTADREFRGHQWLSYLIRRGSPFRLGLPNHTKTHNRQRNARLPVTRLFPLQIGETMVLNRARRLWGHTLYWVGPRARGGEPVIVITPPVPKKALEDYKKRWETECLFAALKRRGFNLEETHMTDPERVSRLVAVLTLALCWCDKVGLWVDQKKPITLKKHQRRACSVLGLGWDTLRHLWLNAASKTTQLKRMIQLLFKKTTTTVNSYG